MCRQNPDDYSRPRLAAPSPAFAERDSSLDPRPCRDAIQYFPLSRRPVLRPEYAALPDIRAAKLLLKFPLNAASAAKRKRSAEREVGTSFRRLRDHFPGRQ